MVSVNYALIGSNGDAIEFDTENYILNSEFTGFNVAPMNVRIEESAGDGGVFRHSKKSVRTFDLSITTVGDNEADVQTKLRRLSRLIQDNQGPTTLEARYSNDETLQIQVYYVGGAEGQWGTDAGFTWNRWVLSFQAPTPFWEQSDEITFTIGQSGEPRSLLPQLTKLRVSGLTVFGEVIVNNLGDVPSFPKWEIVGPISELLISNGSQSFSIPSLIESGEVITVETATGKVYDSEGVNQYSLLGPAPKLFQLPPGETTITVNGVGASESTKVRFIYKPRFEVVH
jgi:phage-related protein